MDIIEASQSTGEQKAELQLARCDKSGVKIMCKETYLGRALSSILSLLLSVTTMSPQ